MNRVHVVVPAGIDDPARVSGGNRYDREVCDDLRRAGWQVTEIAAGGSWPRPDPPALAALARALDALPDGALVLADGLVACAARTVLVPCSRRLRLVVLVHMVFGGDAVGADDEAAVLAAARAVITTSHWTRRRLLDRYHLAAAGLHVARPGTGPAPVSPRSAGGGRLLCVGTLAPVKGQDLLLAALGDLAGLPWRCTLVGSRDRDPRFAAALVRRAAATGIGDRVRMTGVRTGEALRRAYQEADLLVVPSRAETYGMAVTEALAAGLPVLATRVGGLPESVGRTAAGPPGLLVPPAHPAALGAALARWLTDRALRDRLRDAALLRRETLERWPATGTRVREVLAAVGAEPDAPAIRVDR
ncbi:glycosyltransferase family 4 protein [Blastococcus sp. MG754426]|uniref:glycosyltransferase family 4 protein n=1 Tax=unclassified Blastococcus TaxID=2619396 RepID=UPI001EF0A9EA|nr:MULTISPECIES: glycosyltransferase family 4 protein [unclassified Blastococcus]MCF6507171.1 glycosyltransferase family 4 protein [Blastococcus sp. MG754426]MCF6512677.1 glycosyltransferase family 4 protein [Blastococcus sp. MG754427]MCF6735472.1 glycosyltransferase family 4 protein [Blastococcus sp. KM273129]